MLPQLPTLTTSAVPFTYLVSPFPSTTHKHYRKNDKTRNQHPRFSRHHLHRVRGAHGVCVSWLLHGHKPCVRQGLSQNRVPPDFLEISTARNLRHFPTNRSWSIIKCLFRNLGPTSGMRRARANIRRVHRCNHRLENLIRCRTSPLITAPARKNKIAAIRRTADRTRNDMIQRGRIIVPTTFPSRATAVMTKIPAPTQQSAKLQ